MGFVLFFFAAWLVVFGFAAMPKSLSVVENTFLFLIVLIVSINFSWIIIEELKYIRVTKNGLGYTAYLLLRSLVIPMVYVILFNVVYKMRSTTATLFTVIVSLGVLLGLNELARYYGIFTYTNWNLSFDGLYAGGILMAIFLLLWLFRKATHAEVKRA